MNPTAEEKDANRYAYFEKQGFTVLRFENKMVFDNLSSVLQQIKDSFKNI